LIMKMTPDEHQAALWLLSADELKRHLYVAGKIAELKAQLSAPELKEGFTPKAVKAKQGEDPAAPSVAISRLQRIRTSLPQRAPLKDPKPGSLRSMVHAVLRRAGEPMRRATVIEAVARERGVAVDATLRAKVGDVLGNRHDPFLTRVTTGTYAMATPFSDAHCL
jgi:hypothetical protein